MADKNSIAIIVPVRNDTDGLQKLIEELLAQSPRADSVVIVNAGECDGVIRSCGEQALDEPRLRVVNAPNALPGEARNAGIEQSDADIIVHIDTGCAVSATWLARLVKPLLENSADFVTGNVLARYTPAHWLGVEYDLGLVLFACSPWIRRSDSNMAGGASVAYRRTLWEKAEGQPSGMRVGEDVLFAVKVRGLGVRHVFAPDSICYWQAGPRVVDVWRRKYRYLCTDMVLPIYRRAVPPTALRTVVTLGLLGGAVLSWYCLVVLGAGAVLLTFRSAMKAVNRYRQLPAHGEAGHLSPARAFVFMSGIAGGLLCAEQCAIVRGWLMRIFGRKRRAAMRHYLKTFSSS